MTKLEFLDHLRKALAGLPLEDIETSVEYYKESIEDRMEDGLSEEEAVAAMGDTETIARDILAEIPLPRLVKQKMKRKRSPWQMILVILGFPLWFPLLAAFGAVVLAVYITLWAVVVSLYAMPISLGACGLAMLLAATIGAATGGYPFAILALGLCFVLVGLCIFSFLACNLCIKGAAWCTKKLGLGVKRSFVRKEAKQ